MNVGITFIFITHDQQEALSISDRIAVMNEGKVLQVGTPAEVYEAPADSFVADFIGENNFFDGRIVSIQNDTYATLVNDDLGELIFEMDKPAKVGDYVQVSIRPEKIKLSKTMPKKLHENYNILKVYVDDAVTEKAGEKSVQKSENTFSVGYEPQKEGRKSELTFEQVRVFNQALTAEQLNEATDPNAEKCCTLA